MTDATLSAREQLKESIEKRIIVRNTHTVRIVGGHNDQMDWLFDFRSALLDAKFLDCVADIFWESCADRYPFQVGGLETASIPIIASIILKGKTRGTPVNGFYIRKSRKPQGLQKIIEGVMNDEPIILVDDLLNNGTSFLKQINILEKENRKPVALFAIVRFRPLEDYTFAHEHGLKIITPFSLEEFGLKVHTHAHLPKHGAFTVQWSVPGIAPQYFYRVPKSAPTIDDTKVYYGTDEGILYARSQDTGEEVWRFKILGFGVQGKTIFSSPSLHDGTVYFGAYDGNFYALDTETGKKKWIYMDADWIGSSPCVASDLGLVYIGLEYGLFKKRGGIVALDTKTGTKKWEYISMPELTHGSPAYSKKFGIVVIGSNDGCVYAFRAHDGKALWKLQVGGEIKASLAFDEKRGYIIFASFDGGIYIVRVKDGSVVFTHSTGMSLYSTPLVSGDHVYVSGLDKNIYCINLDTFDLEWAFETNGRVFASPMVAEGKLYVGSNDGCLYMLNLTTGKNEGYLQVPERITNKVAYNKDTKRFFMTTYANDLYCLEKKSNETL